MAANVLGIGFDNVIKVPCDSDGRMRVDKLEEEINRSRINGQTPFCVIATSGTTVRGAFDPLREIAEICSNQNIWLHVDAAWGGSCLFSNKLRVLMDGVELADSVCWDAQNDGFTSCLFSVFNQKTRDIKENLLPWKRRTLPLLGRCRGY